MAGHVAWRGRGCLEGAARQEAGRGAVFEHPGMGERESRALARSISPSSFRLMRGDEVARGIREPGDEDSTTAVVASPEVHLK